MDRPEHEADPIGRIEIELLTLVRHLETFGRRSDLYARVDRAGYLALRTLDELGAMNIHALSETLHLDASTVTRQVGVMQVEGLVDRRLDRVDRRSSVVVLTPAGRRIMRSVERKRRRLFASLTKDWSSEDQENFGRLTATLNVSLIERDVAVRDTRHSGSSMRRAKE
ncbi:MAG TPA: MarR family transcriptional regulator [Acidimicrobiales bacterium]